MIARRIYQPFQRPAYETQGAKMYTNVYATGEVPAEQDLSP
jgi:hypothetical protein